MIMTIKELIIKHCKPVLESKLLEKMEDAVLNYSIGQKCSLRKLSKQAVTAGRGRSSK